MICSNGHTIPFVGERTGQCLFCQATAYPTVTEILSEPSLGVVPGVRAPQLQLAQAVENNMKEGGVLLAEAPTGVGKSFACLVPALASLSKCER